MSVPFVFEGLRREHSLLALALFSVTCTGHDTEQAKVSLSMAVGADTVGRMNVHGQLNHCPRVTMEATPVVAYTFQHVRVHSMSVDPEGHALTFAWSARPDGSFAKANAILTAYKCASEGQKQLSVRVTDAYGCTSSRSVEIHCVRPSAHRARGLKPI